jgi:hypothetical protein
MLFYCSAGVQYWLASALTVSVLVKGRSLAIITLLAEVYFTSLAS